MTTPDRNEKLQITISYLLVIVFIIAVFKVPYGYYQLVRLLGTIGFGMLAYYEFVKNSIIWAVIFGVSVIILNPVIKVSFSKNEWQVLDLLFAVLVSIYIVLNKRRGKIVKTTPNEY